MSQSWKFPTSRCNTLPSNKCDFLYRNARLASPLDSPLIQYAFYLRDIRFKVLTVQLLHPIGLPSGSPRSLQLAVALLDLVHRHPCTSIFSHDTEVHPLIPGIKLRSIFPYNTRSCFTSSMFGDQWASSTHLYVLRSVRGSNPSRTRLSLNGPSTMTYAAAGRYTCLLLSRRTGADSVHHTYRLMSFQEKTMLTIGTVDESLRRTDYESPISTRPAFLGNATERSTHR
jgi:hypothetical protein